MPVADFPLPSGDVQPSALPPTYVPLPYGHVPRCPDGFACRPISEWLGEFCRPDLLRCPKGHSCQPIVHGGKGQGVGIGPEQGTEAKDVAGYETEYDTADETEYDTGDETEYDTDDETDDDEPQGLDK